MTDEEDETWPKIYRCDKCGTITRVFDNDLVICPMIQEGGCIYIRCRHSRPHLWNENGPNDKPCTKSRCDWNKEAPRELRCVPVFPVPQKVGFDPLKPPQPISESAKKAADTLLKKLGM